MTNSLKLTAIGLAATFGLAAAAAADVTGQMPPASTKKGVTYAADIKPILDQSCIKCHSGNKPKARLRLDSLESALRGSKDGKVILAGNSASSQLVLSASHLATDKDLWMPPKRAEKKFAPLTAGQIGLIRAWIDQGAK